MSLTSNTDRPVIFDYRSIPKYLGEMLRWRKREDPGFSVRKAAGPGCSPSLVTQVTQGRRQLTRERVGSFSRVLGLNRHETAYLDQWVARERAPLEPEAAPAPGKAAARSAPQNHLLSDWLNVYVKDASALVGFKPDATVIHRLLGGLAPIQRIERSLQYLLKQGFLRRTLDGRVIKNDSLTTTSDGIPNAKIRAFHKNALLLAQRGIDAYPVHSRRECAMVLCLDAASAEELKALLKKFHEQLMKFAEEHPAEKERLYQVLINLSPLGGNYEK